MNRRTIQAILLTAFAAILTSCTGTIPIIPEQAVRSPHISQEVTVYRDKMGVPHIYGNTKPDIMFAVGYTMAEDRLFQLELIRRVGSGELAEIFGESVVDVDKKARIEAYTKAELTGMYEAMDPEMKQLFQAMTAGINYYVRQAISEPEVKMPLEFKSLDIPMKVYHETDILTALSPVIRTYSTTGGNELLNQQFFDELVEQYGQKDAKIIFDDILVINDPDAYTTMSDHPKVSKKITDFSFQTTTASGTNLKKIVSSDRLARLKTAALLEEMGIPKGASRSMTIGQSRSTSGNVLMMQATADGHEIHINGAGINVAGLSMVPYGMPVMGRTQDLGWLITTGERDTIDTFVEKLNPENRYQYWYKGQWRDMKVRTEIIDVKDGEPITLKVARTVHGPVVQWDLDHNRAYSRKWAAWLTEAMAWSGFISISTVNSVAEFEQLMSNNKSKGNNNISVGDKDGNIAVWHTGYLPKRAAGVDPRLPTPGTGEYEWQEFDPGLETAHLKNPEKDFLFVWNNKPTAESNYGDASRWGKHFRTYKPISLIEQTPKISVETLKRFNHTIANAWGSVDLTVTSPAFFRSAWRSALSKKPNQVVEEAVELMLSWNELYEDKNQDGRYDHAGLTLFSSWLPIAQQMIFEDDIKEWWQSLDEDVYIKYRTSLLIRVLEGDAAGLPMKWDYFNGKPQDQIVLETLTRTIAKLTEEFGTDDMTKWKKPVYWRYLSRGGADKAGSTRPAPEEPAYIRESPVAGAAVKLGYLPDAVEHNGLPDWTAIMEIGKTPPKLLSVIPSGGQSWFINTDWKASPHINDQYLRHRDFDYKTIEMDKKRVLQGVESTLTLTPIP